MNKLKKEQAYKSMLMFGLFSIVMLFAGLTSAYIVSKGYLGSNWKSVQLPDAFLYSTILIALSSVFLIFSNKKYINKDEASSKNFLLIAVILGILFLISQYFGWISLINNEYFFVGSGNASSYVYIFSGVHLAHVLFGLFFLIHSLLKMMLLKNFDKNIISNSKFFSKESTITLKLKFWFWHFLGFLWVYLYGFLHLYN